MVINHHAHFHFILKPIFNHVFNCLKPRTFQSMGQTSSNKPAPPISAHRSSGHPCCAHQLRGLVTNSILDRESFPPHTPSTVPRIHPNTHTKTNLSSNMDVGLVDALCDYSRPVFLFGACDMPPPGTLNPRCRAAPQTTKNATLQRDFALSRTLYPTGRLSSHRLMLRPASCVRETPKGILLSISV